MKNNNNKSTQGAIRGYMFRNTFGPLNPRNIYSIFFPMDRSKTHKSANMNFNYTWCKATFKN